MSYLPSNIRPDTPSATLRLMQRDLRQRLNRGEYIEHPDLEQDARDQIADIGAELLRRDIESLAVAS